MTTAGPNYISGITTATFENTDVVNKSYVDGLSGSLPSQTGNAGEFLTTTDGVSVSWDYVSNYQEFSTTGSPQTFTVPSQANILYVEAVGAGGGGSTGTTGSQLSGTGGSGGSYTSWYIPKPIVTSNITMDIGIGGAGAKTESTSGSAGAGTTISWTGPGGTYTLVANGGGAGGVAGIAQTNITSYYYTTAGGSGGIAASGIGVTATAQANSFQSTGGGSGAGTPSSAGGAGGSITFYGNTIFSAGGDNTGSNGAVGIAITSLPYGFGGGGGGAGASSAGAGGNGTCGGGGGGGAAIGSTFGNGGNGGDGFVRITWW